MANTQRINYKRANKMKNIYLTFALIFFALMFNGCSDDKDNNPLQGTDNNIISLVLTTSDGTEYPAAIGDTLIRVTAPKGITLTGATARYELGELASIQPDPADVTSWDEEQYFRVVSYNGSIREYLYRVEREDVLEEGSVRLNTQAEVNAFAEKGITTIAGNLFLGNNSTTEDPITDLSPLNHLEVVKNYLYINSSFAGTALSELENLKEVGALVIPDNVGSEVLDIELPMLEYVGKINIACGQVGKIILPKLKSVLEFTLSSSPQLAVIDMPLLESCVGEMSIRAGNVAPITQLSFPKLTAIQGNLSLEQFSYLEEVSMPLLQSVSGNIALRTLDQVEKLDFSTLEEVGGSFTIQAVERLVNLALPSLSTIKTDLSISNLNIKVLELPKLTTLGGRITLSGNAQMTKINIPQLEQVNNFNIEIAQGFNAGQSDLSEINVPLLKEITGNLTVKGIFENMPVFSLPTLETLGAFSFTAATSSQAEIKISFPQLKTCGNFQLFSVPGLTEIDLPELKEMGTFSNNLPTMKFTELNFPKLEKLAGVSLMSNNLKSFSAPNLTSITGGFTLRMTQNFATFDVPALKEIGGKLWMIGSSDANLTSFTGFDNLTSLQSAEITGYPNLKDFSGFKNVDFDVVSSWKVFNCGYNPDLEAMKNGKFVSE